MHSSFPDALHAPGPAADRADRMGLYAWLIGDWEMDARVHLNDGSIHTGRGEIHFGWVLEGRAIQDVWILPGIFYGTTLRVYDPSLDTWHILWSDPVRQLYRRQLGRARGADIVQEGVDDAGLPTRWTFTEIAPDAFLWLGEHAPDGATFRLQAEFRARRLRLAREAGEADSRPQPRAGEGQRQPGEGRHLVRAAGEVESAKRTG
jgi:hypothetical protein